MATVKPTTDHDEIRSWVEARGGHPARVTETGSRNDPGILRIDFPGYSGEETLEEMEWDDFFEAFDRNKLAVLLSDDPESRFSKLVSRKTAAASRKRPAAKKASTKKASTKNASSKKSSAKKSSAKKASAKRAPAKKASAKKASRKAPSAKKSSKKSTKKASRKK